MLFKSEVFFGHHTGTNLIFIIFWGGPPAVRAPENITALEDKDRNLTCNVPKSPVVNITWTEVSTGSQSNGTKLHLKNINRNDAGEYKCEATNDCGNSSATLFLTVPCK